ncbi:MAG TPA: NAD(P)H-dependent oxidoreductase [Candidatus Paceibacterota bacterium]
MKKKNILIFLAHPDKSGMCGASADAYEASAREAGHTVHRLNVGDMQFDSDLKKGYRAIQELEPDLKQFQQWVEECDHFVIIHPLWWYGLPAKAKGLFDRAWLPGSAFRYLKTKTGDTSIFWHRLYRGKTARIIVTSGAPALLVRLLPGGANTQLRWGILWFAGFSVRTTWFGQAEHSSEEKKTRWIAKVRTLGKRGV